MAALSQREQDHMVQLLKQKYISPFKIIYLIDQKQADHFKSRNKNFGCCTASEITIQPANQTKLQKGLSELITVSAIKASMNQLLEYCQDRFQSIVEKGKKDNLTITKDVQKYLVDNILSQSVNKFVYNKLINKLAAESQSMSTDIGLWATLPTWNIKYPNVKLQLFQPKEIAALFTQGYTVLDKKIDNFKDKVVEELCLLEKDGRFEQILWKKNQKQEQRNGNESKILANPMKYGSLDQDSYFKNVARTCILLQGIPFELNAKANCYLTICDNLQVYYYNSSPFQTKRQTNFCKFDILLSLGTDLIIKTNNSEIELKSGNIFIISNPFSYEFVANKKQKNDCFIVRCSVSQAKRKA